MHNQKTHTAIAALALGVTFVSGSALAQTVPGITATEIKIGQTMPYSGPASGYATQGKNQTAYFSMLNARGGIGGRKINLISLDDAYSPPKTVEQVRKLVEQDEVFATFGILGTPTNSAVHKYLNQKKVPQLFIATGADKWNDPKNYPYTISLLPNYNMEARIAAKYILKNKPDAKIAVLYQNDDFGKDYLRGLKEGLGDKAAKLIVKEMPYEVTDPTIDSQMVALKSSGADTFVDIVTVKFAAQAIKKAAEMNWKPLHYMVSVATSIKTVMEPAGVENSAGIVSALAWKFASDPRWKDAQDVKDYLAFLKEYNPSSDPGDLSASIGYVTSWLTTQVLEKCGNDLTRENLMKVVTSLKDVQMPMALPGVTISLSPANYSAFSKLQMARFDGKTWEPIGPVISADEAEK